MNDEDNITDSIKKTEDELKSSYEHIKLMTMEMRLQFDTMVEMQKEERVVLLEHNEKQNKRLHHVIIGLIVTLIALCILFSSISIYFVSNYDLGALIQQDVSNQSGSVDIFDGIHYAIGG